MAKIKTVGKISEVMGMDWNAPKKSEVIQGVERVLRSMTGTTLAIFTPVAFAPKAFAASAAAVNSCVKSGAANDTFLNLHGSIMNMFSAGVVLVIIFSGAAWALGHKS